jgi:hypothetical protein
MNYIFCISAIIFLSNCKGQTDKKEIYDKQFNWNITIPENFENVSAEQWQKMQNKGSAAVEKTYGQKVENQAKTIFVFKSTDMNYFESNYQPFDSIEDGNYLESCKNVNEMLYTTFKSQMPDTKIDSSSSTEVISGLQFQKFEVKIKMPNNIVLNCLLFSRLFDKKEFSCNMMYVDVAKGESMLRAWRNSRFGNK